MSKWERCDGYDGTEQIAVCPCCQAAAEKIEELESMLYAQEDVAPLYAEIKRLESLLAWIENHEPQLVEAAKKARR
jgi:hypothetical protein